MGPLERANLNHWMLALPKGPNTVGVSLPSPEDGNRISFQNDVFSSYLEFQRMEESRNPMSVERSIPL
jgi:hypothetical protein